MTATSECPPSKLLPTVIDDLKRAEEEKGTISSESVQKHLGTLAMAGIYTAAVENVPHPGPFRNYHREQNTLRYNERLAANTEAQVGKTEYFRKARQEGVVGLKIAEVFAGARGAQLHNVHIANPRYNRKKQLVDGTGVATVARTSFVNADLADGFASWAQAQFERKKRHNIGFEPATADWKPPEDPWSEAWAPSRRQYDDAGNRLDADPVPPVPHPDIVRIEGDPTEYTFRLFNEGPMRALRKCLINILGVQLPEHKATLKKWQETHTFHPLIVDLLASMAAVYERAWAKGPEHGVIKGDYSTPGLLPERRHRDGKPQPIQATEAGILSKFLRDIMNGSLRHDLELRGKDSRNNQELDPDENEHYYATKGYNVARLPVGKNEDYDGPRQAIALGIRDQAERGVRRYIQKLKADVRGVVLDIVSEALQRVTSRDVGLPTPANIAWSVARVALRRGGRVIASCARVGGDMFGWFKQRSVARARLTAIREELEAKLQSIEPGTETDVWPEVKPLDEGRGEAGHRAVEIIKAIVAMNQAMLAYQEPMEESTTEPGVGRIPDTASQVI